MNMQNFMTQANFKQNVSRGKSIGGMVVNNNNQLHNRYESKDSFSNRGTFDANANHGFKSQLSGSNIGAGNY